MGIFDWFTKKPQAPRVDLARTKPEAARVEAPRPVCANCGRSHGSGSGFGGMVDKCGGCGKLTCRSCKKLESYHQLCPLCGGRNWSTI